MFRLKRSLADRLFSDYIRTRDKGTCQRCFTPYELPTSALHCSHFWGRGNKSVRFDPDNAMAACYGCHRWLTANPAAHRDFFLKRLGEKRFDVLGVRARTPTKIDEKLIVIALKEEMKRLK